MKSKLTIVFAAVLFATTIGLESSHAQVDQVVKADVPFDFYAGKQKMPAGSYTLSFDFGSNNVEIMDGDGHGMFLLRSGIDNNKSPGAALLFDKLGDTYFLKTLETSDVDITFSISNAEKKLAVNTSATPVVVAANLR